MSDDELMTSTGPEHYREAEDSLAHAARMTYEMRPDDLAGELAVISLRLDALAHAQLATAAALVQPIISSSPEVRAAWAAAVDPTNVVARSDHPAR